MDTLLSPTPRQLEVCICCDLETAAELLQGEKDESNGCRRSQLGGSRFVRSACFLYYILGLVCTRARTRINLTRYFTVCMQRHVYDPSNAQEYPGVKVLAEELCNPLRFTSF